MVEQAGNLCRPSPWKRCRKQWTPGMSSEWKLSGQSLDCNINGNPRPMCDRSSAAPVASQFLMTASSSRGQILPAFVTSCYISLRCYGMPYCCAVSICTLIANTLVFVKSIDSHSPFWWLSWQSGGMRAACAHRWKYEGRRDRDHL